MEDLALERKPGIVEGSIQTHLRIVMIQSSETGSRRDLGATDNIWRNNQDLEQNWGR